MIRPFSEDGGFVQYNHRKREEKGGIGSMFRDVMKGYSIHLIFEGTTKKTFFNWKALFIHGMNDHIYLN